MPIRLKRAYDKPQESDGRRVLIDRVWPRGVKKEALRLDVWLKEIAPSPELRRWFGHDPARWQEFRRRYFAELDARPEPVADLLDRMRQGPVTFIYAAKDEEHNNAAALKDYLEKMARRE